jgi:uncharacterized protein YlzI (FlbEa/FlbD family)
MTNNFIKLTQTDEKVVYLNATFIEGIDQRADHTLVTMAFGSENFYRVTETPEQIIKKIEDTGTFKTIFK